MPILSDIMDHDIIGPAIRQGRLEGLREVVRHLIEKRFGPMSAPMETQLMGLTASELDLLALRVIDVKSADELFTKS